LFHFILTVVWYLYKYFKYVIYPLYGPPGWVLDARLATLLCKTLLLRNPKKPGSNLTKAFKECYGSKKGCFAKVDEDDDDGGGGGDLFIVHREKIFVGPQHVQNVGIIVIRMIPWKFSFESTGRVHKAPVLAEFFHSTLAIQKPKKGHDPEPASATSHPSIHPWKQVANFKFQQLCPK
jgi:hypothetical protein